MSIYSGFAKRQLQQTYDHCVNSLLYVLQKRIIKIYTHQKTDQYKFATLVQKMFLQLKHMEKSKYLDPKCSCALQQLMDVLQKTNLSEHNATQQNNSNRNATIQGSEFQNQQENQKQLAQNKNESDEVIFQRNYHPNKSYHLRQNKYHNGKQHKPIFNVPILNNNNNCSNSNSSKKDVIKNNQASIKNQNQNQNQKEDKKKISLKKNQENTSNQRIRLKLLNNYEAAHIGKQKKQSSFSTTNHKTLNHITNQNTNKVVQPQPAKIFGISQSKTKIQNVSINHQQKTSLSGIGIQSNIRSRIASSNGQRQKIHNNNNGNNTAIFNTYNTHNQSKHFQKSAEKDQSTKIQRNSSNSQNNYRNSYSSFNRKKIQKPNEASQQINFLKQGNFSPQQYQLISKNGVQLSEIIKDYIKRVKKGGPQQYKKTKDWALLSRFQDY